jgi:thiaminase
MGNRQDLENSEDESDSGGQSAEMGVEDMPEPASAADSPYREWVDTYADPGFERLATALEDLLDRLGGDPAVMAAHYRKAMRLELAFFAAAHQQAR